MSKLSFKNNIETTLGADLYADGTAAYFNQIIVSDSPQERLDAWPTVVGTGSNRVYFYLTLEDTETKEFEIVRVTGVAANNKDRIRFSIDRGQDGTTARDFDKNKTIVQHRLNAAAIESFTKDVVLPDVYMTGTEATGAANYIVGSTRLAANESGLLATYGKVSHKMLTTTGASEGKVLSYTNGSVNWADVPAQDASVIARDAGGNIKTSDAAKYPGMGRTASAGSLDPDKSSMYNTSYGCVSGGVGPRNTAIGYGAKTTGDHHTVVGADATTATGSNAVVIGAVAKALKNSGTAVGAKAETGLLGTAVGYGAIASGDRSLALGAYAKSARLYSTAIGAESITSKTNQVSIANLDQGTHLASSPRLLSGVATPVVDQDAANKAYVDAAIAALRTELTA